MKSSPVWLKRFVRDVADTDEILMNAVRAGKNILLEGQLGTLRDPDHGIYPMVTSSRRWRAMHRLVQGSPCGPSVTLRQ